MDIFGIKRRKAQRAEEMHKVYKERKAHYEDTWYDIEDVSFSDISCMIYEIYNNVHDLRERTYDRRFDSIDEIVNHILTLTRLTLTIYHRDIISIDIIEILMYSEWASRELANKIGSCRYETDDRFFIK